MVDFYLYKSKSSQTFRVGALSQFRYAKFSINVKYSGKYIIEVVSDVKWDKLS